MSAGLDQLTNEMLIDLSDFEPLSIFKFANKTWSKGKIPTNWRESNIIPILRKGKQPNDVSSNRPISLTSNLGKAAERIINERLY
jgi:hypothetical protein